MGGKNDTPVIGHKIYLGFHAVPCSMMDSLTEISVGENVLWSGDVYEGRVGFHKPNLLDTSIPRGGISGTVDVLSGDPDQGLNDYLTKLYEGENSAFRGVVSVVARQPYLGNSDTLDPWSFKINRINKTDAGRNTQWYQEKATIPSSKAVIAGAALYIVLDGSSSMSGTPMAEQKIAIVGLLQEMKLEETGQQNDIQIAVFSTISPMPSITKRNCNDAKYDDLIDWVIAIPEITTGGTDFGIAFENAYNFFIGKSSFSSAADDVFNFTGVNTVLDLLGVNQKNKGSKDKRRIAIFTTDGIPDVGTEQVAVEYISQISNLEVYCFNIDLVDTEKTELLDNTPRDGVPVVVGGNSEALLSSIRAAFSIGDDMNAVHILREIYFEKSLGGDADNSQFDDTWIPAADTAFEERFGLSFFWDDNLTRSEFREVVENHLDAVVYEDRETGLYGINLIRDDYEISELPVFDREYVVDWGEPSIPSDIRILPNKLTVKYMDRSKKDFAAVTISDETRIIQAGGQIVAPTEEFRGAYSEELAATICSKRLLAVKSPLRAATSQFRYFPNDINLGDAIVLNEPELGYNNMVVRVQEIEDGNATDNIVSVKWSEDKSKFPRARAVVGDPVPNTSVTNYPQPAEYRFVEESPYYEIVRRLGQYETDALLLDDDTIGFLNLSCESPTQDTYNAIVTVDEGDGFEDTGSTSLMVVAKLKSHLNRRADRVRALVEYNDSLGEVRFGSVAAIDGEFVRIDNIQTNWSLFDLDDLFIVEDLFADTALVTLGRGCLDTVPAAHQGSSVMFWGDVAGTDRVERFAGSDTPVKLRPRTPRGILDEDDAPTDVVSFDQRAIRPYPVGNLKLNGDYSEVLGLGDISITWAHRDRIIQTTGIFDDHTVGDIGPETGTSYKVSISGVSNEGVETGLIGQIHVGPAVSHIFDPDELSGSLLFQNIMFNPENLFDLGFDENIAKIRIGVVSVRDGYEGWQLPTLDAALFRAPTNLNLTEIL